MTDLLIGIDLGTSAVKAVAASADGEELAHAGVPTPWTPCSTGAEMRLPELRRAALEAAAAVLERTPPGPVLGVGVTGMAETGVLLAPDGSPLSPLIAWHDSRGGREVERLAAGLGAERFRATTGLSPSTTPTIVKLAWLEAHDGAVGRARRWLGAPEALVHLLGGDPVADLSLACRTGLLDLRAAGWWDDALDWLGAPASLLAELAPSGTRVGAVKSAPDVPPRLHGAALAVAGHDHLAAAVGAGAISSDEVFDSCGTAEALVRATAPLPDDALAEAVAAGLSVSWHVLPGMQALMAASPTGLFLTSVLELLGRAAPEERDALDAAATTLAGGELCFTGIGEVAALHGIRPGGSPEQVWRAAVDSATQALAGALADIERLGGPFERLVATGGWTRSRLVLLAKSARFGPLALPAVTEAAARGAALIGGVAAGLYPGVAEVPPPAHPDARSDTRALATKEGSP